VSGRIHHGDCREVMRSWGPACFDAIVTDPPYGLGFMGKGWDGVVPGVESWAEALRVTVPGGRLVAFGGPRTSHRLVCSIEDAGWVIEDSIEWLYGQGFPKAKSKLKPAHEPICLARKPGPIAELGIDACRIGTTKEVPGTPRSARQGDIYGTIGADNAENSGHDPNVGRWPANVILGCACSVEHDPECAVALLDAQSGTLETHGGQVTAAMAGMGYGGGIGAARTVVNDRGGASRFFYVAKATREERERWLQPPPDGGRANKHPTVKPVALMRWLVRLVGGPRGSRILDPFCGSGTTGVACALEGYAFEGIELEQESADVASERIAGAGGLLAV
jgi:DNA modification methylase